MGTVSEDRKDLKERVFAFAVATGKLIRELPYNTVNKAYTGQLIRSSSFVGSNYRAARRAKPGADFINKLKIVEEEADESVYFLEPLMVFNPDFKEKISLLAEEVTSILKMIVASIITARSGINKPRGYNRSL
ncbi:MAG: four helix bundle protein [Sphingobacteriales bacterium]|nr:four helix bundle protein [Sphingobacteriales bacterium]